MSNARELAELGGSYGTGGFVGMKNRIINGAMMIDQRNAAASVTPADGQYTVDRFSAGLTQASKFSVQQSTTAPAGFVNSLLCTSLSAYSVGSGDTFLVQQNIEGLNCSDLGWGTASAASVTLSFWVRSSLTGTFGGALKNSAANRSYPFSYTISATNTWEQKTVTIAGDTSGTWLTTNGIGIRVIFGLGSGSTFSGTAGSWAAGNLSNCTGATSVVGTSGATFYITGVQLEKGSTATSFDYRPYGTELALCQRYYWRNSYTVANTRFGQGVAASTTLIDGAIFSLPVQMRASPTATVSSCNCWDGSANNAITSIGAVYSSPIVMSVALNTTGLTAGRCVQVHSTNNTSAFVSADAEL